MSADDFRVWPFKSVHSGCIDPREFTIVTPPARFEKVGDLSAKLRTSKAADLEAVFRKYASWRR